MNYRSCKRYANVFCIHHIQFIGGVEQYLYELALKYGKKYDITILYVGTKNPAQVERLKAVLGEDRVVKYTGETIYADVVFLPYNLEPFISHICDDAYVVNVTHANFYNQNLPIPYHPRINKYIGVSDYVCEGFKKQSKKKRIPIETCYNPIGIRDADKDRVLLLVSATRLSKEKGKERMQVLADELEKNGVKFIWLVFTNDRHNPINNKHVIYQEPTLDIRPYLAKADYVVQLSDTEGYSYTILESLCLETPVIVTDLPVFHEMGVNEDTGILLPLDMSDIPIDTIKNKEFRFKYTPKNDGYEKLMTLKKTRMEKINMVKLKAKIKFYATVENVHLNPGDVFECEEERAKQICDKGYAEMLEEPKAEKPKRKRKNARKVSE